MSKSKKKVNALNDVAQLLAQFQQRLDKIEKVHTEQIGELSSRVVSLGIEASRVDDSLAALIEHFDGLEADHDELDGTTAKLFEDLDGALVEKSEELTKALYTLRDSTQKSFDGVSADVKVLLEENKRLNERIIQLENSLNIFKNDEVNKLYDSLYEGRLKAVEVE